MKKLAVFVEGQTEQILIEKLLLEIAGQNNITIELVKGSGGSKNSLRTTTLLRKHLGAADARYYVLIFDCGTDNRVASDIRERYQSLISSGYTSIIGVRDVFPLKTEEIPELRRGIAKYIPTIPVEVTHVLGVMEIESWFLAEHTHYEKIDTALTLTLIIENLGFNPQIDDLQIRRNPAKDLDDVYSLANKRYTKSRKHISRTTDLLDYSHIYLSMNEKFPDLKLLNETITRFLTN